MYAIVSSGGKQYRAIPGEVLHLEHLAAGVGDSVTLDAVLLVDGESGLKIGNPLVDKACVTGKVVAQGRDHKIRVFKYKKRKHYRRTKGHRQSFTAVRIEKILA